MAQRSRRSAARAVLVALAATGLVTCAKVARPTGGPVDKTPPVVIGTSPADSAVNVPRSERVRIRFSKRMNTSSVGRALFITPYPEPYPYLDWSFGESTVSLRFPGGLDSDRTYIITVGTGAQGVHNNRLAVARSFAFSTGASLASGRVVGSLYNEALAPAVGATVGLYPLPTDTSTVDPSTEYPYYTTQTGDDGGFAFGYLSAGRYRVFAWEDRNTDELIEPDEASAVPSRDVSLSEGAVDSLPPMRLSKKDVRPPALAVIAATDRVHVQLRFDEPIPADSVRIAIDKPDTLRTVVIPTAEPDQTVIVRTSPMKRGALYRARVRAADAAGNVGEWGPDSTVFDAAASPDTTPPHVVATIPPDLLRTGGKGPVTLVFDDVLGPTPLDSLVALRDSVRVPGTWSIAGINRLSFTPDSAVPPGRTKWFVPLAHVRDASGNEGRDTAIVLLNRTPPDSLGTLKGSVIDSTAEAKGDSSPIVLRIRALQGKVTSIDSVPSPRFGVPAPWSFSGLPAGKYLIEAWRDRDRNGAWSAGSIVPFRPSERWTESDTLDVRARWTSSGAVIRFR